MMKCIHTSVINGEIYAPASKSYTIRALAGALLAEGYSQIVNPAICDDTKVAIGIIENLGAEVEHSLNSIKVKGGLRIKNNIINCGESALCVRLFSAMAPLFNDGIKLEGCGTLLKRDFSDVVQSLAGFGIECSSNQGRLPLTIRGSYHKNEIKIDCSVSSQFLSGLLFTLPKLNSDTNVIVTNLQSKPYIDLTLEILGYFGIKIYHDEFRIFKIQGNQKYLPTNIIVEGDWSNAAFILVSGAVAGSVKVHGLNIDSNQGDRKILEVLDKSGALITIDKDFIQVSKNKLDAFKYNATDTPDLFPPLVGLAVNCKGISEISGVNRLRNKESNRLDALISEFTKLGINIYFSNNTLFVEGGDIKGCEVNSHKDHRIAMALVIAGLNSEEQIKINDSEFVSKSYPEFFNDLKKIGGQIDE